MISKTSVLMVFIVFSVGALVRMVSAQDSAGPPRYIIAQYHRAASRTIDAILRQVRPTLSKGRRDDLDKISIRVNRTDWNIFGVYARKNGLQREIHLSMGFIIAADFIDTAVVAAQRGSVREEILVEYVGKFVDAVVDNMRRARRGQHRRPEPDFPSHVGWSIEEWRTLTENPEFVAHKEVVKLASFAFILGHELSHHFEGHLDNEGSSIEEEREADQEGVKLAVAAGYNPLLAFHTFILFAALEGDQEVNDSTRIHPAPICRAKFLIDAGVKEARKDKEFISYLHDHDQYDEWMASIQKLNRAFGEESPDC